MAIITECDDGFQYHVSGALDGPLVVLFEQRCPDLLDYGRLLPEEADDVAAARDLTVEALDRVRGVDLGAVLRRGAHVGHSRPPADLPGAQRLLAPGSLSYATTLGANRSPPVRRLEKPQVFRGFARRARGSASATNVRIALPMANSLRDLGLWGFRPQAIVH
jgi:hypothetical protein